MFSASTQQRTFYLLLIGTFLIHMAFMLVKIRDQFSETVSWVKKPEVMKVKIVPTTVIKDSPTTQKRQIVQSEDSASNEKKDDAYLSDKTRSFDRETLARNIDSFQKAALGNSAATSVAQKGETTKELKKTPDIKNLKLSDIGMGSEPMPQKLSRAPASAGLKGMENGDPTSQGLSATNDYVEDVALGDFTQMNTVEFKFYGFYHRIRQKLEQFWGKSIQEKSMALFKSGRRMPASQNLITSLQVTLNAEGEIIGVKILGASGVKELDDAAIESFNQAGPFPNPPKDLLVNGKATIEWGFVVKS